MNNGFADWKDLPDGNEKRHAYMASREWALLKEAVKKRSGGTCEHCHRVPGTQTHHRTYARLYAERLEDLLHVCEPCHLFLSGKADRPARRTAVPSAYRPRVVPDPEPDARLDRLRDLDFGLTVPVHSEPGFEEFQIGVVVVHPQYGIGEIAEFEVHKSLGFCVTVLFELSGIHQFVVSKSPLKLIEPEGSP